jgi:hypothetical protein
MMSSEELTYTMRTTIIAALLVFSAGPAGARDYPSYDVAFADTLRDGRLTPGSVQWIVATQEYNWGLKWEVRASRRGGVDVRGYPSQNRAFCVLVWALYGEFGQHGDATYRLLDTNGRPLWMREGTVLAPPIVSNDGMVATVQSSPNHNWPACRIELRSARDELLYSRTWNDVVRAPLMRSDFTGVYAFSTDGLFVATLNLPEEYSLQIDGETVSEFWDTKLCIFDCADLTDVIVRLGWFVPRSIEFGEDGAMIVHGMWGPFFWIEGPKLGSCAVSRDGKVISKNFKSPPSSSP